MLMYLDLDPQRWPDGSSNILNHDIIKKFFSSSEKVSAGSFQEEYEIDNIEEINEDFPLIDDADSSQHSALIDAIKGRSLVIEGPPGTGKSQTITNLIAAALGQGKTVLFVAEKLAALEVVKRRLDKANLGDFCLELHSHKTQKRKMLEDLRHRMSKSYTNVRDWQDELDRHSELRDTLRNHAELINTEYLGTGKTVYEILTAATRYRHELNIEPEDIHPNNFDPKKFSNAQLRNIQQNIRSYGEVYELVLQQLGGGKDLSSHPWYGIRDVSLQHFDSKSVCEHLLYWNEGLTKLDGALRLLSEYIGVSFSSIGDLEKIKKLSTQLAVASEINGTEKLDVLKNLNPQNCDAIDASLQEFSKLSSERRELLAQVNENIIGHPGSVETLIANLSRVANAGIAGSTTLTEINELGLQLSTLNQLAESLDNTLKQVISALPEDVSTYFDGTIGSYGELLKFLDLAAQLNPMLFGSRDDFFEQETLDQSLLDLAAGIQTARPLRDELRYIFDLDRAYKLDELNEIESVFGQHKGVLAWFSKDWRHARKRLLGLRVSETKKFIELEKALPALINYQTQISALYGSHDFAICLGRYFDGLDTDIDPLIGLRTWYRTVRAEYGLGFGPKVFLGNALVQLPSSVLQGIRSLQDQGVFDQIRRLVIGVDEMVVRFHKIKSLQNGHAMVSGIEGFIPRLQKLVANATTVGFKVFKNDQNSIENMLSTLGLLLKSETEIEAWEQEGLIEKVFGTQMLSITDAQKSDETSLIDTLSLARKIFSLPPEITSHISAMDNPDHFRVLGEKNGDVQRASEIEQIAYKEVVEQTNLDLSLWTASCGLNTTAIIARNQEALDNPDWMSHWVNFYRFRNVLWEIGFEKLTTEIEGGNISLGNAYAACMLGLYDMLARHIFHEVPAVAHFASSQHTTIQQQFQENDHELKKIQQKRVAWKCSRREPPPGVSGGRVKNLTEMGLITRETEKKAKHVPIRDLVKRSQHALVALKPCFMMGPMSVAQYLEPGVLEFDLLIMDEASQIRPEDALGAIARSKQVVIVGDPKQLPPTSFFDKLIDGGDDEDDTSVLQESESILESVGQLFDYRRLRWHYRSQHESLIKFSNMNFYDGNLVLFPSPHSESDEFGVKFHHVTRGRFVNRRNTEEGKAVAEAVCHHLKTSNESVGVVAMSVGQRDQIEKAFEGIQKQDLALQGAIDKNLASEDPLFFKNLENVQGDERDVIFISCTYGPQDHGGPVHQRFGPINSENGWRRLNVLFTRSKKRMHVFSSMQYTDIIPGANTKEGVVAFRNFLEYAATGRTSHPQITGKDADSDFEIDVASMLYKHGYECEFQVGAAGYFIDLAVRDPGNPGQFLMGIECDGATYHSAKSVRDRDRLRQQILENLGWEIRRIWSTDWFSNPESQLNPIIEELNSLKSEVIEPISLDNSSLSESEQQTLAFLDEGNDLTIEQALKHLDQEVISIDSEDIDVDRKLLSSSMIDALTEFQPTTRSEFTEMIPQYLRSKVDPSQGKYIDQVLEVIENFEIDRV